MIGRLISALGAEIEFLAEAFVLRWPGTQLGQVLRRQYYRRKMGRRLGANAWIGVNTQIVPHERIEIGDNFVTGAGVYIGADQSLGIRIGRDVSLAHGAFIRAANHSYFDVGRPITAQGHFTREIACEDGGRFSIVIEDDVWIGAYAVILAGARIGRGAVIGAGAVVAGDIPSQAIVAGNPARVIGDRNNPIFAKNAGTVPPAANPTTRSAGA